jgi:hypothetical protein
LRGFVYFDIRRGMMSPLVRDLSDEGGRIIFSHTVTIPDVINLHIPQREKTFCAQVRWRRGDEIGLAFAAADAAAVTSPQESELIQRVAQLETQITALRRTLKQLKHESLGDGEIEAA